MATTARPSTDSHIRKRPFQPSITSYFNSRNATTPQSARPTSPLSPSLPAETQASLLSVGMRVRKSVPEGYKTHKTLGIAGFPFPSTAPAVQTTPSQQIYSGGSPKELMPFCGLHKTGGWAMQEPPSSSAPAAMQRFEASSEEFMAVPALTMSQSSSGSQQGVCSSFQSVQPPSRKRNHEEETEEEIDAYFDEVEAQDAADQQMERDDRPIARMKQSSGKVRIGGPVRVFGEDDFEDAAFLAPLDGMEVDGI